MVRLIIGPQQFIKTMNDIKAIRLTDGGFTIVDNADFESLNSKRWGRNPSGHVRRYRKVGGVNHIIYMHREIMNAPDGVEVDHANGYPHDNTRRNLRFGNTSQNQGNAKLQERDKTAPFKGVTYHKRDKKWQASITHKMRLIWLGYFDTPEAAALAYNAAAQKQWGEFARLNPV